MLILMNYKNNTLNEELKQILKKEMKQKKILK